MAPMKHLLRLLALVAMLAMVATPCTGDNDTADRNTAVAHLPATADREPGQTLTVYGRAEAASCSTCSSSRPG